MRFLPPALALLLSAAPAHAQCGGNFSTFVAAIKTEIRAQGLTARQADSFLAGVVQDARGAARRPRAELFS